MAIKPMAAGFQDENLVRAGDIKKAAGWQPWVNLGSEQSMCFVGGLLGHGRLLR